MENNINVEEFKQIIQSYENEKIGLQKQLQDLEKEKIIKNERLAQLKANLESSYGTSNIDELQNILKTNIDFLIKAKQEIDTL